MIPWRVLSSPLMWLGVATVTGYIFNCYCLLIQKRHGKPRDVPLPPPKSDDDDTVVQEDGTRVQRREETEAPAELPTQKSQERTADLTDPKARQSAGTSAQASRPCNKEKMLDLIEEAIERAQEKNYALYDDGCYTDEDYDRKLPFGNPYIQKKYIKKLVGEHQDCNENESCALRDTLLSLDSLVTVKQDCPIKKRIISDTNKLVRIFADVMGSFHQAFRSSVQLKGSMSNDLKVGKPDEVDYLLMLDVQLKEEDGWVLHQPDNTLPQHFETWMQLGRLDHLRMYRGYTNCYQVSYQRKDGVQNLRQAEQLAILKMFHAKTEGTDIAACLPAPNVVTEFRNTFTYTVLFLRERLQSLVLHVDSWALVYRPTYARFSVKIDLNPCIRYVRKDGTFLDLVPHAEANTWKACNNDAPELHIDVVKQAIRVTKALVEMTKCNKLPFLNKCHQMYYVAYQPDQKFRCYYVLSRLLTVYFAAADFSPSPAVKSYGIVGSTVNCYREKQVHSLCTLVLQTLNNFDMINPDKQKLLQGYGIRLLKLPPKTFIHKCATVLHNLMKAETNVENLIPVSFSYSPTPCLAADIRKQFSPPDTFSYPDVEPSENVKRSEECEHYEENTTAFNNLWEVYKVNTVEFSSWLLQQHPRFEKALTVYQDEEGDDKYASGKELLDYLPEVGEFIHIAALSLPRELVLKLDAHFLSFSESTTILECLTKVTSKIYKEANNGLDDLMIVKQK